MIVESSELAEVVTETLDAVLESSAGPPPSASLAPSESYIRATVEIQGGQPASLEVGVDANAGVELAAMIMQATAAELSLEDAADSIAELTNMMAGAVKTLLDEETVLATPTVDVVAGAPALAAESIVVDHPLGSYQVALTTD